MLKPGKLDVEMIELSGITGSNIFWESCGLLRVNHSVDLGAFWIV